MSRSGLLLAVALLLGFGAAAARAQEFPDEDSKKFYQEYKNRLDASDLLGVNKQVGRDKRTAETVIDILCYHYVATGTDEALAEIGPLARALDEVTQGTRYEKRLAYIQTLTPEQHQKRSDGIGKLIRANELYDKARASKEANDFRQALMAFDETLQIMAEIKDMEYSSIARFKLGYCNENLGEYGETVKAYDVAMDEWVASGRPKADDNYAWMVEKRRELIDRGYTPEGDTPGSAEGGPSKNTSTSFVEGSAWEDWSTSYKTMKKPDQFTAPSLFGSDYLLLWKQFGFLPGETRELKFWQACEPFGTPLKIIRDGAKGLIDTNDDGQGDVEAKIIDGKPNLTEVANGKGKDAPRYALWMVTGGQNQQWLGQQVNYQNLGFYRTACYREGELLGEKLILIDDNCTGSYGDPREDRDGIHRKTPTYYDTDTMILGKSDPMPYSDFIRVKDKWYRLKLVDPSASTLRTREMNLESGTVRVDWEGPKPPVSLVVREVRELQGAYFDVAGKDPVTVPVGRYEIAYGRLETGKKTSTKQAWILKGESKPFEVKAGEETVLEMGAPYDLDFKVQNNSDKFIVEGKSLLIYDRMDALIAHVFPDVLLPEVSVRNAENQSILKKNEKLRLITADQFNSDNVAAWFFQDFEMDKPSGVKCEAQLSLTKKHPLLGGPFESEWK